MKRQAAEAVADVGHPLECTRRGERVLADMLDRRRRSRRIAVRPIDIQKGVDDLARAIQQIEISLRRADREVRTDRRDRIRQLRTEAREQLLLLREYEREAMRILMRLCRAPKGSWDHLEQAADRALREAREIADSILARCRRTLSE